MRYWGGFGEITFPTTMVANSFVSITPKSLVWLWNLDRPFRKEKIRDNEKNTHMTCLICFSNDLYKESAGTVYADF